MGFPARGASAFPGKREEANRAGITPRILVGTIDHSIVVRPQNCSQRFRYHERVNLTIDLDREEDGRWIAEALELPGVMSYGKTREQAISNAERLAIEIIADRITHGELPCSALSVSFTITDEQMARH
jgi:predicted RNase H-like HicB family nuclease